MRAFIAIDVDLNTHIKHIYDELSGSLAKLKLVEPENLHITLKFLGDITPSQQKEIDDIIIESIEDITPIPFTVFGMGVFPNFNNIRIIWLGIKEGNAEIASLARTIDMKMQTLGFKKEKSYTPHITISRMKTAQGKDDIRSIVLRHEHDSIIQTICTSIKLKQSILTPQGPIYSDVEVFHL